MGRKYYLDPETGEKIYIRDKAPSMKHYRKAAEQDVIDAKKTEKTRIDFDGEQFTLNGEVLNYQQLHDIHLVEPDFAFVVYGDRAYLLSYVQDTEGQMREMRWESSIATQTAVKTSGIYVISNDGIEIAGVSVRDINSENQGNKVNELTDTNKNSTINYPSNAAVSKEIDKLNQDLADLVPKTDYAPVPKTSSMTQPVGKDENGQLFTEPGGGGGGTFTVPPMPTSNLTIKYNPSSRQVGFTFVAPGDYALNGEMLAEVAGIKVMRKKDSEPVDENDGILVADISREDMGNYELTQFIDETLVAVDGDVWVYKLFPYATTGKYNTESVNAAMIEIGAYELYGFIYDQNEANPLANIEYIEDNTEYTPAHMDYTTGKFDYGSWGDAWFIKDLKPCMLKYDGTVDYLLDPDDYTKKADGSASDVLNDAYEGNAMVGIPTVWLKYTDNGDGTTTVLICDQNIDGTFSAYAHTDENGNIMPYTYVPCYNGSVVSNKLRSLSGKACMNNQNGTTEITYANANNQNGAHMWYTELFCDRQLINTLLMLIGRSTNTQKTFGNGHYQGGTSAANLLTTGTMDKKGLFWGSDGDGVGVKVFGIENYYGNQWRRIGGWMCENGTQRIKMTRGAHDGSTTIGYNTTAVGYISIAGATPTGTSGGYIKKQKATQYGFIPYEATGSDSTYLCDGLWYVTNTTTYALVGGACGAGLRVGAFCSGLIAAVSNADWDFGAAISCKPPV